MKDEEPYYLKHNTYQKTLIQNLGFLRESSVLVDCILEAEGEYLKAHKIILSASSLYFANLFKGSHRDDTLFIFSDIGFQELRTIVDFMYRGEVLISPDKVEKFLITAKALQIDGFFESGTFSLSVENKNNVFQQNFLITQNNYHLTNSFSDPPKLEKYSIDSSIVDNLPEKSSFCSNASKGISTRESSRSSDLKKRKKHKKRKRKSKSINTNEDDLLPPVLELAVDPIDDKSHIAESCIQPKSEDLYILDDCQLPDDPTKIKDNNLEDLTSREAFQSSEQNNKKRQKRNNGTILTDLNKIEQLPLVLNTAATVNDKSENSIQSKSEALDFKADCLLGTKTENNNLNGLSSRIHHQVIPSLKITNVTHYTSHNTKNFIEINSESFENHCSKILKRKTKISNKKVLKSSTFPHRRGPKNKGDYSCPNCNQRYKSIATLTTHLKYNCGKIHCCPQCGNTYRNIISLKRHTDHECGKEPQFQCDICKRRLTQKGNLVKHIQRHTDQENYVQVRGTDEIITTELIS